MRCPNCGADNFNSADQCTYCSSPLPRPAELRRDEIFARIKASPEYANRLSPERLAKLPTFSGFHKAFLLGFFILFIGGSGFMFLMATGMAGVFGFVGFRQVGGPGAGFSLAPLCMSIVPLGFVIFGVMLYRSISSRMNRIESAPVEALPVIVVDKRLETRKSSDSSSTSFHITCETESGQRDEYQVWDGQMYGRIVVDDAGILYLRDRFGVDFDRVVL